jgi:dUTP pyrophosphatase
MRISVKKLRPNAQLPQQSNEFAGAYDLFVSDWDLYEYGIVVKTGIALEIPTGYRGIVVPRSSISKQPLFLHNSTGVIDSDYRGEILLKFALFGQEFDIKRGDRIGQLYIEEVIPLEFIETIQLNETERGGKGFGSSGR